MTKREEKHIDYAYPTSTHADQFGFKDGCWVVSVADQPHSIAQAVKAFPGKGEALAFARTMPMPWGQIWKMYDADVAAEDPDHFDNLS